MSEGAEMKVQFYTVTMQKHYAQDGYRYVEPYALQCHVAASRLSDALKQAQTFYDSINKPGSFESIQHIHVQLLEGEILGLP